MTEVSSSEQSETPQIEVPRLQIIERLLSLKATTVIKSPHFWIVTGLIAVFGYIYYGVLTAFHDVYVVLFFYPLLYAAVVFRMRGVLGSSLFFLCILLPHALIFSEDPYSLVRSLLFAAFAFLLSGLVATQLNYLERQLEAYREIIALNEELNNYIERLESTQRQLIQAEKLNAIGQLAASIAHEINNPLAGVLVYTKLVSKKIGSESYDKGETLNNLSKIESAVNHCSKLVKGLLDFSRQSKPVFNPVLISSVIDQVMSLVGHQANMKSIKVLREETPQLPPVMADFDQLQQVFLNLIINAIQAMPDGGKLTIRSALEKDGRVSISIQDTGCGISPENMEKLFIPFFTTKEKGKGVGLGLAVSYGIIERHNGKIDVQSKPGEGSAFTVHLPAYIGNKISPK